MRFAIEQKARSLDPGYSVEIDAVDEPSWYRLLEEFSDANIYQTWAYDEVRSGRGHISHLLLRKDGEVVAAAQARIVRLPVIGAGIAYVRWGPMWRKRSHHPNAGWFRQAIRALRNEYACNRGLVIRLRSALFREVSPDFASILADEGYSVAAAAPERTLRLDLTKTTEELRGGMRPHWRRYLKVAEKSQLEVVEGDGDVLFEEFVTIYRQLVTRKAFAEPNDIREFRAIQKRLPKPFKMKVWLCKEDGKLCSGLICSTMGDTAVYLYGATSDAGLKSRGSYLLHWKLIQWLKEIGVATYDLHGINPATNPGTHKFKADLCGSNGQDVHFFQPYEAYDSRLSYGCVTLGERLKHMLRPNRANGGHVSEPVAAPGSNAAPLVAAGSGQSRGDAA